MGAIVPRMEAALPLCTASERRCLRNCVDLFSPVMLQILPPTSLMKSAPALPHVPRVSMTIGTKSCALVSATYFADLRASALAATVPASTADCITWDGARVSGHVASQRRHRPLDHGMRVTPSGRLPSPRFSPGGSRRPELRGQARP